MVNSFAATGPSRFAGISRWPARLILLFLLLLSLYGIREGVPLRPAEAGPIQRQDHADVLLYEQVVESVRAGQDYHAAAAREHRDRGYPLRPFITVRLPTLAWVQAHLPPLGSAMLLYILVAATLAAWAWRLNVGGLPLQRALLGGLLLLTGAATLLLPELIVWHEGWAALLVALALVVRSHRTYWLSALIALCAALIREQAALMPLVMLGVALVENRRGEALAWSLVIAGFLAFVGWHASEVAKVVFPTDLASPGWAGSGGWQAVSSMIIETGPLRLFPAWVSALIVPIALAGWAGWKSSTAVRGTFFLAAYLLLLGTMARPDNFYWAFLIAPLMPIGLLFAPRAIADLLRASSPHPRRDPPPARLST